MTDDGALPLYVITDHPRDFPDYYVVRVQYAQRDGTIRRDAKAHCFHELWKARAWCEEQGLVCIPRHPDDDPVIVESWV